MQKELKPGSGQTSEIQTLRDWLEASGEMADLIRKMDWSATPLGPRDGWPQSLCTVINLVLASSFPIAILWGSDLIFIYNDAYGVIAADKHPNAMGRSTRDAWPEVWEFNKPIFERVMAKGETVHIKDQLFRIFRQGYMEDAYFTLCYSPIRNETSQVAGTMVVLLETTGHVLLEEQVKANKTLEAQIAAQKLAEEALRESREAYRTLANNSPDNIDRLDRDSRHLYVNAAAAKLFGLSPESVIGKTNRELGTPDPWAGLWEKRISQVFETNQPLEVEDSFHTKDGPRFWQIRCVPERASDGKVASVLAVSRDITEQKHAEKELKLNLARLDWVLATTGIGMWLNEMPLSNLNWDAQTRRLFSFRLKPSRTLNCSGAAYIPMTANPNDWQSNRQSGITAYTKLIIGQSILTRGKSAGFTLRVRPLMHLMGRQSFLMESTTTLLIARRPSEI